MPQGAFGRDACLSLSMSVSSSDRKEILNFTNSGDKNTKIFVMVKEPNIDFRMTVKVHGKICVIIGLICSVA